jgi:hypothetical protein
LTGDTVDFDTLVEESKMVDRATTKNEVVTRELEQIEEKRLNGFIPPAPKPPIEYTKTEYKGGGRKRKAATPVVTETTSTDEEETESTEE